MKKCVGRRVTQSDRLYSKNKGHVYCQFEGDEGCCCDHGGVWILPGKAWIGFFVDFFHWISGWHKSFTIFTLKSNIPKTLKTVLWTESRTLTLNWKTFFTFSRVFSRSFGIFRDYGRPTEWMNISSLAKCEKTRVCQHTRTVPSSKQQICTFLLFFHKFLFGFSVLSLLFCVCVFSLPPLQIKIQWKN